MKFMAPSWLYACLMIPIIYGLVVFDEKRRLNALKRFAREGIWSRIAPELEPKARLRKARVWLLALLFTFVALARPQWGSHEETVHSSGLDLVVALDLSNSMEVEDIVPSRLQKAKHLIRSLVDQLPGDRLGIVGFAESSDVMCPLTNDLAYVLQVVQTLSPKSIQNQGTDIGAGLDVALRALDRAAEAPTRADASRELSSRVIVLITDGEDHESLATEVAKKIKDSGVKLYILGVGTQRGGPIPVKDNAGNRVGFKKDAQGQPVVSEFHPNELVELAGTAGGRYLSTTPGEDEIKELVADLGALSRTDNSEHRYVVYDEHFQIPLALAITLFFLELFVPARKRVKILPVVLLFLASQAHAGPVSSLDSYFENEEGLKSFKEGKIEDAQKKFGEAQARDPGKPEWDFNQGVTQLEKNPDAAVESFRNAARESMERGDQKLFGKSMYNLGQTFVKKGDLKSAAKAYIASINSALAQKDSNLEADARKNLELLQQEKKKQEQQKQDQKQDPKQDQNKNQDQKQNKKPDQGQNQKPQDKPQDKPGDKSGDKKKSDPGQEKQEQEKEKEKRYQDPSQARRQFQSKKLSAQDAENVIDKLREREKQLQLEQRKRHENPQSTDKDW